MLDGPQSWSGRCGGEVSYFAGTETRFLGRPTRIPATMPARMLASIRQKSVGFVRYEESVDEVDDCVPG
jgi:hypothetical protein